MSFSAKFEERWKNFMKLKDCNGDKVSDWCIKSKNDFTGICVFCNVTFNITNGVHAILMHSKSSRHRTVSETKSSQTQFNNEKILRNSTSLNIEPSSSSEMKPYTVNNEAELMSDYEKKLLEKRTKNQEFLKSLHIDEIKHDAAKAVYSMKRREPKEFKERSLPVIQRASKRKKEHIDYSVKQIFSMKVLKHPPTEKSFEKALKHKREYRSLVEDFTEITEANDCIMQTPISYDRNIFKKLVLKTSTNKIPNADAISWFPSTKDLVLAVGDRYGNLCLSTFKKSKLDFYTFPIHSKKISHLQFNPYNPSHLISSSFDGKVLCCDIQAQMFSEVSNTPEKGCTYFDFISPSSYIVSLTNGQVTVIDSRKQQEDPKYRSKFRACHSHQILTINMHPVNKNYFVSAARKDNYICVWDLRHMKSPVIRKMTYRKKVSSVTFSPVSGTFLLSKFSDEIRIFDSTSMTEGRMKPYSSFKFSGKMVLDDTRAVWLPNSDNFFACTLKNSPSLQIFDKDLVAYEKILMNDQACKKFFTFHPFQRALACIGNADKISVYA